MRLFSPTNLHSYDWPQPAHLSQSDGCHNVVYVTMWHLLQCHNPIFVTMRCASCFHYIFIAGITWHAATFIYFLNCCLFLNALWCLAPIWCLSQCHNVAVVTKYHKLVIVVSITKCNNVEFATECDISFS